LINGGIGLGLANVHNEAVRKKSKVTIFIMLQVKLSVGQLFAIYEFSAKSNTVLDII
jgi:hypothetical protein